MVKLIYVVLGIPKETSVQYEVLDTVSCLFFIFWVIDKILEFFFGQGCLIFLFGVRIQLLRRLDAISDIHVSFIIWTNIIK